MNPDTLLMIITVSFGILAGLDELHRIKFKYNKNTPLGVIIGSSMFAAGALFIGIHPKLCALLIVMGRVVYAFYNRRERVKKENQNDIKRINAS